MNVIPTCYNNIVSAFSKEKIGQGIEFNKYIKSEILTEDVYISIDKDVLSESEAVTNWDQENMKLSQLFNFIKCIFINKNICGIDVCGEVSVKVLVPNFIVLNVLKYPSKSYFFFTRIF